MKRGAVTRAAVTFAAVFALAALFYMELRQAVLLAALAGGAAFLLCRGRG